MSANDVTSEDMGTKEELIKENASSSEATDTGVIGRREGERGPIQSFHCRHALAVPKKTQKGGGKEKDLPLSEGKSPRGVGVEKLVTYEMSHKQNKKE